MENKTIEELLNKLAALAGDARGSLFGQDKCMVDREELLYLVDALQNQLPSEISEARTIINSCNALRNKAKMEAAETRKEANNVLRDAQERAAKLIEEHQITEFAKKREQEILDEANEKRDALISGAVQYADRILEEARETVSKTMETLTLGMQALEEQSKNQISASLHDIDEARGALKAAEKKA